MEKLSVSCNKIFVYKGNDTARDFYDMKETLTESALAYATVVKSHAEFTRGRSSSDD